MEGDHAISGVDGILGLNAACLHGGHEGCEFEGGARLNRSANGVVVGLVIGWRLLAIAIAISSQIGHGSNFPCRHFHENDRSPRGVVIQKLPLKCPRCDILQMHVNG